jgi:xylitol oxidase
MGTSSSSAPVRNWARNVEFAATRVHRPSTLDELRAAVVGAESVRVLGTGHSFNRIAEPADGSGADAGTRPGSGSDERPGARSGSALILTGGLPATVEIDAAAGTATVAGGMRLAEISARLHEQGFALPNLPSLPHISLAGAVMTGTHGSGDGNRSLAGFVRGLRMLGPDGELVELTREDPGSDAGPGSESGSGDFAGAVVGLGALGVVTHLTVDLLPAFEVAQHVVRDVPLDAVIERQAEVSAAGYSVSVFTEWASGRCTIWRKLRAEQDGTFAAPEPDFLGLGGRLAAQAEHPVPGMPAGNCTQQLGVPGPWHERLPHFRPEFTPSSGEELQSEFFVARERAREALEAVRRLASKVAPVLQISEIRTVAADELWLSPAQGRDSVALHFTWIADRAAVAPALAAVEEALLPLGARPHWGKVFSGGPEAAVATYPRAAEFRSLMERRDPQGRFRNPFVRRLFP